MSRTRSPRRPTGAAKIPAPHLPWTPGARATTRVLGSLAGFEGQDVVVTAKMDGENTTLMRSTRARSTGAAPVAHDDQGAHARRRRHPEGGGRSAARTSRPSTRSATANLPDVFLLFLPVWDEEPVPRGARRRLGLAARPRHRARALPRPVGRRPRARALHPTLDGWRDARAVVRIGRGLPLRGLQSAAWEANRARHHRPTSTGYARAVRLNGIVREGVAGEGGRQGGGGRGRSGKGPIAAAADRDLRRGAGRLLEIAGRGAGRAGMPCVLPSGTRGVDRGGRKLADRCRLGRLRRRRRPLPRGGERRGRRRHGGGGAAREPGTPSAGRERADGRFMTRGIGRIGPLADHYSPHEAGRAAGASSRAARRRR